MDAIDTLVQISCDLASGLSASDRCRRLLDSKGLVKHHVGGVRFDDTNGIAVADQRPCQQHHRRALARAALSEDPDLAIA